MELTVEDLIEAVRVVAEEDLGMGVMPGKAPTP